MNRPILLLAACLLLALPAQAAPQFTVTGTDGSLPASSTNPLPVALGASVGTSDVNVKQINGVTTTMGNGVSGTGVQRVTLASDSTGQVTLAAGSATIGALTANQSVNVAQINGVTPLMGNGASGTGACRVTIANDSTGIIQLATGTNTIGALTANQTVDLNRLGGSALSATNPVPIRLSVDGTNYMDATHGGYVNILSGNAVNSNSNPIFSAQGSTTNANSSNITQDLVATTSTAISGLSAARNLTVINGDATAVIYVDIKSGTASNTNGLRLGPGQGHTWSGMKDTITGFTYYSTAAGTKTLSYSTW